MVAFPTIQRSHSNRQLRRVPCLCPRYPLILVKKVLPIRQKPGKVLLGRCAPESKRRRPTRRAGGLDCCLARQTMTPLRLQLPPRPRGASASVSTGPPPASIFFSLPPAKNATDRLSGDQKGNVAPSVPASGWAVNPSSERIHKDWFPSAVCLPCAHQIRPGGRRGTVPAGQYRW